MDYSEEPSVAVILVNWNGYAFTSQCIKSLEAVTYTNFHAIVVDNGSTDDSLSRLEEEYTYPIYLKSPENLGFAEGNNLGIRYALEKGYDFILLLNNDTEVEPDFLSHLVDYMVEHPDKNLGVVQPLIMFNHDRKTIWSAGGKFHKASGNSQTLMGGKTNVDLSISYPIDWVTGCCMLLTASCIRETGLLNASYFAYFEDVDWSLRIRSLGYSLYLIPKAKVYHEAGASSKKSHEEGTLHPIVFYYTSRNQLFQIRQHIRFPYSWIAWPFQLIKLGLWMAYFLLRGRRTKLAAVFWGIRDGIWLNPEGEIPVSWRRNFFKLR
ncbi:glycosyltransferase family 2 protein [Lunatibacter salilacus]|uniref:glycosyltransferase family 2 protein n=1 Tax=Lunatibacter salilacus TaxID=2483804 RepID=UPI00131A8809|nr:glycosyltransferase family 2 protein [Lunatibacter salilacus]